MKYILTILIAISILNTSIAQENNTANEIRSSVDTSGIDLNEVIISANVFFGSKANTINRTGSGYYLSNSELSKQNHTDISRILSKVPGVSSYDEDGFGLRPNISLRGVSAQRSAKITIMEDGVLISPAPYSAPAAYYFPMAQRMSAVEVLKGSSQIEFGPFTTGGAINMVSTPITSDKITGKAKFSAGSFGNRNAGFSLSQNLGQIGYMIEGYNQGSNGFKELPNGHNTGFNRNDFVAKVRFKTKEEKSIAQSIELKAQYSDELSNETYLGLSQEDFDQNPIARYASSARDKMVAEHFQLMATHTLDLPNSFRLTTVAYRNYFKRDWFKLNDVLLDGQKVSLSNILNDPSQHVEAYQILRGGYSQAGDLLLKHNNRAYISQGVQTKLDKHWTLGNNIHDLEIGARVHYDEEDRFQWLETFRIQNGNMTLMDAGIPGTDANRISSANAFSSHLLYKFTYNHKLTVSPGVRFERAALSRLDYGKNDVDRVGDNISELRNEVNQWIPGIGVNYKPANGLAVFGGVHRGFSPPGINEGSLPESSVNSELGLRVTKKAFYGELVAYNNNYSNLLGSDLAASGGTGSLTLFNAGAVRVQGLEALLNYDIFLGERKDVVIPIEFSYTLTNSEFLSSFNSSEDLWGNVSMGDQLPYIPQHQFFVATGLELDKITAQLTGRYNGAFRTVAGSGEIPQDRLVAGYFVADFATRYQLSDKWKINLNINNLFNNSYLVARVPAGLRPGLPFAAMGGFEFSF